jgi:hypothetical protein
MTITGRMTQFTLNLPGFGDCLFTSTENSIVNMKTQTGVTYGRITASNGPVTILTAVSVGKVYPLLINGQPAMGFQGRFTSVGTGNVVHVKDEYSGYFVPDPDNPFLSSGLLHIDFEFVIR